MLRRKKTLVEVRLEDREELEEARKRAAAAATQFPAAPQHSAASNSGTAAALLAQFDSKPSILTRIGFNISNINISNNQGKIEAARRRRPSGGGGITGPLPPCNHLQENVFFDGSEGELSGARAELRLRFYNGDSRCVVSLKRKAVIVDGISRVEEAEEDVDAALGRSCVVEPWRLVALECGIVKRVLVEYGCKGFVCLGGFRNVRGVFDWQGLTIELDETQYDFGICYEIECESDDPERVKKVLEDFLVENGVPFSHSVKSKFAIFRSGKLTD